MYFLNMTDLFILTVWIEIADFTIKHGDCLMFLWFFELLIGVCLELTLVTLYFIYFHRLMILILMAFEVLLRVGLGLTLITLYYICFTMTSTEIHNMSVHCLLLLFQQVSFHECKFKANLQAAAQKP